MDPTEALRIAIERASRIVQTCEDGKDVSDDDALTLAEHVIAMVRWIQNGGFPPDWKKVRIPDDV